MSASTPTNGTEGQNVLVAERSAVCLFVPGTANKQWTFGVTVGTLMLGSTKGAVLLEHGDLRTKSKRELHEGFKRVQDRSCVVGKPWFPANVYSVDYKEKGMSQILDDIFDAFKAQSADAQQSQLQESDTIYEDALAEKKQVRMTASSVVRPERVAPKKKQESSKWKLHTQVATDKDPVSNLPLECQARWTAGSIVKFYPGECCGYQIEWATKPAPVRERVSQEDARKLVSNFKWCVKHKVLLGIVGLDLLWEREGSSVGKDGSKILDPPTTVLRCGRVDPYDPLTGQYKILFRNGLWCFKTEEEILAQRKWTEEVTLGQHATWTFDDATSAMNDSEASLRFSQIQLPDSDTEGSQSASCASTTKGSTQRALRSREKSVRSEGPTKVTNKANEGNTTRTTQNPMWKCNKTRVATCVVNPRFPDLAKIRTGWCLGHLVAFDPTRDEPYEIEWESVESKPIVKAHVDAKEMALLVEHYKGCRKRLLVEWFAVGLELLVCTPKTTKVNVKGPDRHMVWGYVMWYENESKRYKMLYRDGTDAFVTGKFLDDLIKLNDFYNLEQKRKANTQEWDPRVLTTIASYGTYCVRGILPACLQQNNAILGQVEPPKLPPQVATIPFLEKPNPFKRYHAESPNDSGDYDADDFFKKDINNTDSYVKVVMSSNSQGEGILHTFCPPNGSITYTSHQSYQVAARKVMRHRGSVRSGQPH
jgi:hypothetical protein